MNKPDPISDRMLFKLQEWAKGYRRDRLTLIAFTLAMFQADEEEVVLARIRLLAEDTVHPREKGQERIRELHANVVALAQDLLPVAEAYIGRKRQ